ncbi:MAG TPA: polysaccharide deacetylase family protein [Negativicutes bacterium]|nr:polysaccharide deacetylase family protein [Negativicutes bacterium]
MYVKAIRVSKKYLALGIAITAVIFWFNAEFITGLLCINKLEPIYQGNTQVKKMAFACNVFWGEEYLPGMLEIFQRENVRVTFFLGGSWVKKHPELVKEMALKGHELANHSFSHPHPNNLSKEQNKEQVLQTETLIFSVAQQKTVLYAPPYGEFNQSVLQAADELGYKTIMWTVDTVDWKKPSPEVIKARVLKKAQNGAIVLMHPTEPTLAALPELISELKRQGYVLEPVSSIIK